MIKKCATNQNVINANRKLTGSKVIPHFVTIRGFPTETPQEFIQTILLEIQLVLENKKAMCSSPFLIPTPGTAIARQCYSNSLENLDLEDYACVFDMESNQCPSWLAQETFDMNNRLHKVVGAVTGLNRSWITKWQDFKYRLILRCLRPYLKFLAR